MRCEICGLRKLNEDLCSDTDSKGATIVICRTCFDELHYKQPDIRATMSRIASKTIPTDIVEAQKTINKALEKIQKDIRKCYNCGMDLPIPFATITIENVSLKTIVIKKLCEKCWHEYSTEYAIQEPIK